jgi:hypothetical protein
VKEFCRFMKYNGRGNEKWTPRPFYADFDFAENLP